MAKAKQQLSQKQQYQRLMQAKAQAKRAGQPTPKLDAKIEKLKTLMGSTHHISNLIHVSIRWN